MRLHIGNIHPSTTFTDLVQLLRSNNISFSLINLRNGFAFVEVSVALPQSTLDALNGVSIKGSKITAETSHHDQPQSTRRVHFTGLSGVSWEQLSELGRQVGAIELAKVGSDGGSDHGFIVFEKPEDAVKCASSYDRKVLNGSTLGCYLAIDGRQKASKNGEGSPSHVDFNDVPAIVAELSLDPSSFKILIRRDLIGALIGKGGATIKEIISSCGSRVNVRNTRSSDGIVIISGNVDNVCSTYAAIMQRLEKEAREQDSTLPTEVSAIPLQALIPAELVGHVIGKSGAHIKQMMSESQTVISVLNESETSQYAPFRVLYAEGTIQGVCSAQRLLYTKMASVLGAQQSHQPSVPSFGSPAPLSSKNPMFPMNPMGYPYGMLGAGLFPGMPSSSMPGGPKAMEITLTIPDRLVGVIIGKSGVTIKEIMRLSGAQVRVAKEAVQDPSEQGSESQRVLNITGPLDAALKAQILISQRIPSSDSELVVKVEFSVPLTVVGRIIGKRGTTIREIKSVSGTDVQVVSPAEGSDSQVATVIIHGNLHQSQMAQHYVHQVIDART